MTDDDTFPPSSRWTGPSHEQRLYQTYTVDEDKERTNLHYEQPPEFFCTITGGEWNVYSCNLWDRATTDTESQEAKLDYLAALMDLGPGKRVLDIGCGWGGPLTYLCKTYGVEGVGLTLSPLQKAYADARIARYAVDARVVEAHWQEYEDDRPFDAAFTDEVFAHIGDVPAYAAKTHALLRPGGRLLTKELHFTSSRYKDLSRAAVFIHEIFGLTGYYRTLGEELMAFDGAGFAQIAVQQIDLANYRTTSDRWLANMHRHRDELQVLVGAEHYRKFRGYLKIVRTMFARDTMTLDVVVSSRI